MTETLKVPLKYVFDIGSVLMWHVVNTFKINLID